MRSRFAGCFAWCVATLGTATLSARAQTALPQPPAGGWTAPPPQAQGGWTAPPPQAQGGWTAPPPQAPGTSWTSVPPGGSQPPPPVAPPRGRAATDEEVWTLYGMGTAYGVGAGVWLDEELGATDPGIALLAPAILGVGAPIGVYFLDRPRMPRGMPSAIASGLALGAGEGIGIWAVQSTHAAEGSEWTFRALTRSTFLGATLGGAAGYAAAVTLEPTPRTNLLLDSGAMWGSLVGGMMGYGVSTSGAPWAQRNDGLVIGGFTGYNVGLVGAAALSSVWEPTYRSMTWMWIGFGAGVGVTSPVYLLYAGSGRDATRGLVVQSVAGVLGATAGAVFTLDMPDYAQSSKPSQTAFARVTGAGPMALPGGGVGLQVSGLLF